MANYELFNQISTLRELDSETALVDGLILYEGKTNYIGVPEHRQDMIKRDEVERVFSNYNSWWGKASRALSKAAPTSIRTLEGLTSDEILAFSDGQPVKTILDHNKRQTNQGVGQLASPITKKEIDGKLHLFATVKVSGADNIRKIKAGQYSALSLGYDANSGKIHELSVVTIPALSNCRFLSAEQDVNDNYKTLKSYQSDMIKLQQLERNAELNLRILSALDGMVDKTDLNPVMVQKKFNQLLVHTFDLSESAKLVVEAWIKELTPFSQPRFMQLSAMNQYLNLINKENSNAQ